MQRKELKTGEAKDASKLRIGIVVARFNGDVTEPMLEGALDTLFDWKVDAKKVSVLRVPGAFEIPLGCARLIKTKRFDALIAIGCVIKGETKHDEYIAHAVANGLTNLMLETGTPIGFGVITPNSLAQAKKRSQGDTNHGAAAARAALEMAM